MFNEWNLVQKNFQCLQVFFSTFITSFNKEAFISIISSILNL